MQGKQVSLEWTETSGGHWDGGTTLEFLSPFLCRAPALEMRQERRESLPSTQGKDPSSRARKRKRGSSGCGRDSRASSRVETGMSGNFLSCSKGVKDLWKLQRLGVINLETPQRNGPHLAWRGEPPGCSRVSAGALDLRRGLRDPLSWPQERPVPMPVAQGPLGIPLPSMPGLR